MPSSSMPSWGFLPSHLMTTNAFSAMRRVLGEGTLVINSFGETTEGEDFFSASWRRPCGRCSNRCAFMPQATATFSLSLPIWPVSNRQGTGLRGSPYRLPASCARHVCRAAHNRPRARHRAHGQLQSHRFLRRRHARGSPAALGSLHAVTLRPGYDFCISKGRRRGPGAQARKFQADAILGLPRGGLWSPRNCPNSPAALDVLVVRKIGHPHFRNSPSARWRKQKPWFWISSPLIEPASGGMNSMSHRRKKPSD